MSKDDKKRLTWVAVVVLLFIAYFIYKDAEAFHKMKNERDDALATIEMYERTFEDIRYEAHEALKWDPEDEDYTGILEAALYEIIFMCD